MTTEVKIIVFVISTQWRAFSTQDFFTFVQESLTHSRGGGLLEDLRYNKAEQVTLEEYQRDPEMRGTLRR